jgi:DNA-binding PadR family transcriptional regulator
VTPQVFEVLVALWDGLAFVAEMSDRIELRTGRRPPRASFYRALGSALAAEWIEVVGENDVDLRGRPAKAYRLTKSGRVHVTEQARHLERLISVVLNDPKSHRA